MAECAVKFAEVAGELGLEEHAETLGKQWDSSQRTMPTEIPFLREEFVLWACREVGVPQEIARACAQAAARVCQRGVLRRLAWHLHYRLYVAGDTGWDEVRSWPPLDHLLGEEAGLFYLVVLLSNLPRLRERHRNHQVPEEVTRATLADLSNWLQRGEGDGHMGITPGVLAWLQHHFRGDLYRLGRLQFQFGRFERYLRAFRHRGQGVVVALSEDGLRYTPDGRRAHEDHQSSWTARLLVTEQEAVGYPIHPGGRAVCAEVTLPLNEWRPELAPGDQVLYVHIPGGEPLDHEACGRSFSWAREFFPRHFPEHRFSAFCCTSWVLNTWLEEALPAQANLVRFQHECYLFPTLHWPRGMLQRVFGQEEIDLATAPRDTALRRAIISALERGEDLRGGGGGMFLLPADLRWGKQVYRRQAWPWPAP